MKSNKIDHSLSSPEWEHTVDTLPIALLLLIEESVLVLG